MQASRVQDLTSCLSRTRGSEKREQILNIFYGHGLRGGEEQLVIQVPEKWDGALGGGGLGRESLAGEASLKSCGEGRLL